MGRPPRLGPGQLRARRSFRVLTYDRRGHSQSEAPPGQGHLDQDVADLAGLIETLDLAPAHVAGNSLGSIISLRLASRRPELFRTLTVHEPPALPLLDGDPEMRPMVEAVGERIASIAGMLESGDIPGGTRRFVEDMMGRPGTSFLLQRRRRSCGMPSPGWTRSARVTRRDSRSTSRRLRGTPARPSSRKGTRALRSSAPFWTRWPRRSHRPSATRIRGQATIRT